VVVGLRQPGRFLGRHCGQPTHEANMHNDHLTAWQDIPKHIQHPPTFQPPPRKRFHTLQVCIIHLPPLDLAPLLARCLRPTETLPHHNIGMLLMRRRLSTRQHQIRTPSRKLQGSFPTNAVVAAGNQDPFSRKVGAGDVRGPEDGPFEAGVAFTHAPAVRGEGEGEGRVVGRYCACGCGCG